MCTVSWNVRDTGGYDLYFNRDEQVTRAPALAPAVFTHNDIEAIMPIDPQGGGTWLSANAWGLSFALLNFYQGRLPKGRLISRGQIVKQCARSRTLAEAQAYLASLNLSKYAPFSLLMFDPSMGAETKTGPGVLMLRWNGRDLHTHTQESPLISSAINFEEVRASRLAVYQQGVIMDKSADLDATFRALHASHQPSKSSHSICMHRDDAKTVSFSHVKVDAACVQFFYSGAAPCEVPPQLSATISRL